MGRPIKLPRALRSLIGATASLVGIAMLLTFPAMLNHQFRFHYRAPQVRRTIVRHTFVAQPETDAASHISRADIRPVAVMPALQIQVLRPQPVHSYPILWGSMPRLSQRLKLCPPRINASDPFSLNLA